MAAEKKIKVEVLQGFVYGFEAYGAGELVELDERTAELFIGAGFVRPLVKKSAKKENEE